VSQKLRRNLTHNRRLRPKTCRHCPPRAQPAALRRTRPVGLRHLEMQPRRPRFLRPTPRRRRHPPPSPTRPGQPPRRHPSRLPTPPHPLQRRHRLGTPNTSPGSCSLTLKTLGCLRATTQQHQPIPPQSSLGSRSEAGTFTPTCRRAAWENCDAAVIPRRRCGSRPLLPRATPGSAVGPAGWGRCGRAVRQSRRRPSTTPRRRVRR
jgi:hypothetical protein